MKQQFTHLSVRLPLEVQRALYLIREELKGRKLYHSLRNAEIHDCPYIPNLDGLIFEALNFPERISDEIYIRFSDILDEGSSRIEPNLDSLERQAFKAYIRLRRLKSKLSDFDDEVS